MTDPIIPPAQPAPAYSAAPAAVPGKTLGIVAIPVALFFSVIGIILGFVAMSQSKKAGAKNTPAVVAIILGFVSIVLTIIVIALIAAGIAAACADGTATCTTTSY